MPYVCSRISDGLGNRFFQVAAALGYAEKHGHTPVFIDSWIVETSHAGPKHISNFFPTIQTIDVIPDWTLMESDGSDTFTYIDLPPVKNNVFLKGYFQTEKYFPSGGIPRPLILCGLEERYRNFAFLHVRRGDYLLPVCAHHYVDLTNYYRFALSLFSDQNIKILICSDDMAWCRSQFIHKYTDIIAADRFEFMGDDASDYEALRAMTACGAGGICANSTFSWWGAYWGVGRASGGGIYTMPVRWGAPPLPEPKDLHPDWTFVLPV